MSLSLTLSAAQAVLVQDQASNSTHFRLSRFGQFHGRRGNSALVVFRGKGQGHRDSSPPGIFRQGFEGIPHCVLAHAAFLGDPAEALALPPQTPQLGGVKVDAWSASCDGHKLRKPPDEGVLLGRA